MTIEEKLQHFQETSVEEARNQATKALEAHQKNLDKMFAEHKKTRTQDAQAEIKAETQNAQREVNKALSAQQLTLKRNWNARQKELKDKLFVEVKDRLEDFMNTSEYENYLCKKVREAVEFAGDDEIFIYLSPEDASYQHSLVARTGFPVRVSDEPFMGGIKATIPGKNILIDNSFMEAYQSLKKEFKFDGGLRHE